MSLRDELLAMSDANPSPLMGGTSEEGGVTPREHNMSHYGWSCEIEIAELLYALVRYVKPELAGEAGCYIGIGSYAIGRALLDNGKGRLITCDVDESHCATTVKRCDGLPVDVIHASVLDVEEWPYAQVAFIDSSYETRLPAFDKLLPGALALIHDTRQEPSVRPDGGIDFDTWRGATLIRR